MIKVNGRPIDIEHFPNGESKIAPFFLDGYDDVFVEMIYQNNDDLINLMFIKSFIDEHAPKVYTELDMFYIPYERMDRETHNQMFTSKYFGQFISSLNFNQVKVFDPHSNVSVVSIKNVYQIDINTVIDELKECVEDYIFFPDNGAKKKYAELIDPMPVPYFYGDKHRDLNTGKITDYNVFNAPDLNGKTVLIVDDLCVR